MKIKPRSRSTLSVHSAYSLGVLDACNLIDDLYSRSSTHEFLLGDCILTKLNLLKKGARIRRNPNRAVAESLVKGEFE